MREIVTVTKIFDYEELSDMAKVVAKENVGNDLIETRNTYEFTEIIENNLYNTFKNSDLKIQYSLSYCQGDGFNTYGKVDLEDFFKALRNTKNFKNLFTYKQELYLLELKEYLNLEIPYNNRYCYSVVDRMDIAGERSCELDYYEQEYDMELLEYFEEVFKKFFNKINNYFEKLGYEFFYELGEDELIYNLYYEYTFYEDGSIYSSWRE